MNALALNECLVMNRDGVVVGHPSSLMVNQTTKQAVFIVTFLATPRTERMVHLRTARNLRMPPRRFIEQIRRAFPPKQLKLGRRDDLKVAE